MITISPRERALLDAIASTEAPAYNVMYGHGWSGEDRTFSDYSKHPGKFWPILSGPNKGKKSSAAGRYQFLGSTWDNIARRHGISDFTPASQDMGAVALAREEYARKTKRNLTVDLESDDPSILASIGRVLSETWTSLPSGIEQGQNVDKFVAALQAPPRDNVSISTAMTQAAQAAGGDMMAELGAIKNPSPAPVPETPAPQVPDYTPQVAQLTPIQMAQVMRRTNYS